MNVLKEVANLLVSKTSLYNHALKGFPFDDGMEGDGEWFEDYFLHTPSEFDQNMVMLQLRHLACGKLHVSLIPAAKIGDVPPISQETFDIDFDTDEVILARKVIGFLAVYGGDHFFCSEDITPLFTDNCKLDATNMNS